MDHNEKYQMADEKAHAAGNVHVQSAELLDDHELENTHVGEHGLKRDLVSVLPPLIRHFTPPLNHATKPSSGS